MTVRPLACLVFACALSACGGIDAPVSPPASGAEARLTSLTALDQRVARVAARLSDANADLCPVVRQGAGWALHSARQYSVELRPFAIERFGLSGDLPGVLAAPPGSAAEAAGLRTGDLIVRVDGRALAAGTDDGPARFEGFQANQRVIDAALARGPATLGVRRDGAEIEATVRPRRTCGYEVQLDPSDELNARADGRRLFISTALAGFAQSDDELALILGHELAHHVLGHRRWNEAGGEGRSANTDAATRAQGDPERQADRVGLYLMARAGFDETVAAPFWRRFGESNWRVRYPQLGHDSAGARAVALERVQAEIAAARAAGAPISP